METSQQLSSTERIILNKQYSTRNESSVFRIAIFYASLQDFKGIQDCNNLASYLAQIGLKENG
jgi:hypothetical protein